VKQALKEGNKKVSERHSLPEITMHGDVCYVEVGTKMSYAFLIRWAFTLLANRSRLKQ
jgi:hypothetical protein